MDMDFMLKKCEVSGGSNWMEPLPEILLDKLELWLCDDDPIELSLHGEERRVKGYPKDLTSFF